MNRAARIISAVDHVIETPELWTERISHSTFGDLIPHLERSFDGSDCWILDGRRLPLAEMASVGALMSDRAHVVSCWEEMPKAAYDPAARLKLMDDDSVSYSVLYPSLPGSSGEIFASISDPDLELAGVQAYNDWLIDEWLATSHRFIPQCIVPLCSIPAGVGEIYRAVERGHRGVIFPAEPIHLRNLPHLNSSEYDPIWAACQSLQVPLCFHAGSVPQLQFPISPNLAPELAAAFQAITRPAAMVFDLTNILFSRILLRFPKLQIVLAESTIGWGTFLLEYADHQYQQDHCDYELKPSEMFQRQCHLTTWYDDVKVNARHIGFDNILWSTNFPSANSTWPETQQFVEKCLSGISGDKRQRILFDNAAKLYNIFSQEGTAT